MHEFFTRQIHMHAVVPMYPHDVSPRVDLEIDSRGYKYRSLNNAILIQLLARSTNFEDHSFTRIRLRCFFH